MLLLNLGDDKMRTLTHICPYKSLRKLKIEAIWNYQLSVRFTCDWVSDLVICKQKVWCRVWHHIRCQMSKWDLYTLNNLNLNSIFYFCESYLSYLYILNIDFLSIYFPQIRNAAQAICVDSIADTSVGGKPAGTFPCHGAGGNQVRTTVIQ